MNDVLLFVLSLMGILALYWALIGQWRWNKMMGGHDESDEKH